MPLSPTKSRRTSNAHSSCPPRALSIAQPWAELILRRRKPYELRTWTRKYRGPLLIHASRKVNKVAMQKLGLEGERLPAGAFVGVAVLRDIRPYTKADARLLKHSRGGTGEWGPGTYAWVLTNVRRIKPILFKGRLGIFRPPARILRQLAVAR